MARFSHQQPRAGHRNHLCPLQSPLESGTFLQNPQAEPEDQEIPRHLGQRRQISGSHGPHRLPARVASTPRKQGVDIDSECHGRHRCHAAHERADFTNPERITANYSASAATSVHVSPMKLSRTAVGAYFF